MKDFDTIKSEIENSIKRLSEAGMHTYYAFSVEITLETKQLLESYFSGKGYDTELKQCPRKFYDIILRW